MQRFIPVVCGIIESKNQVLAAKRNVNQTNAGLWEFPGGKVNPGELPADALKRELFEELTISVTVYDQLQIVRYEYSWIAIELIPFICKFDTGDLFAHEHEEVRYFDIFELENVNWAPADLLVIDYYRKYKRNNCRK
jgi:8-oxo-dGTP diphosphatase